MKTILATIAAVFVSLIAFPQKAEAGSFPIGHSVTYKSGYASCGCAVYTKRVITSYDYYRRPVYKYYSVPIVHSCRTGYRSTNKYYGNSSSRFYSNRGSYNRGSTASRFHSNNRFSSSSRSNYGRSNFNRSSHSRSNFSRSNASRSSYSRSSRSSSRSSGRSGGRR